MKLRHGPCTYPSWHLAQASMYIHIYVQSGNDFVHHQLNTASLNNLQSLSPHKGLCSTPHHGQEIRPTTPIPLARGCVRQRRRQQHKALLCVLLHQRHLLLPQADRADACHLRQDQVCAAEDSTKCARDRVEYLGTVPAGYAAAGEAGGCVHGLLGGCRGGTVCLLLFGGQLRMSAFYSYTTLLRRALFGELLETTTLPEMHLMLTSWPALQCLPLRLLRYSRPIRPHGLTAHPD